MLHLTNDGTLHSLYRMTREIQTQLQYSRENVDKTRFVKFHWKAMSTSKNHFPALQGFIYNLNIHISKYGSNNNNLTHTCTSIYQYLVSSEAPKFINGGIQSHHKNNYKNNHCNSLTYTKGHSNVPSTTSTREQVLELMNNQEESSTGGWGKDKEIPLTQRIKLLDNKTNPQKNNISGTCSSVKSLCIPLNIILFFVYWN